MSSRRTPPKNLKRERSSSDTTEEEDKRQKEEEEMIYRWFPNPEEDVYVDFDTEWDKNVEKVKQKEKDEKRLNLQTMPPEIIKSIGDFIPNVKDLSRFRASHPYIYKYINTPISSDTNKILSSDRLIELGVKAIVRDLKQFTNKMMKYYQEVLSLHQDFFDEATASYGNRFLILSEFVQSIKEFPATELESVFSKALKNLYINASDEQRKIDDPYTMVKDLVYIVKNKSNPVITSNMIKSAFSKTSLQILFLEGDELEWYYWDLFRHLIFPNTLNDKHFFISDGESDHFYNPVEIRSRSNPAFKYEDYVNDFEFTTYQQNSEERSEGQYENLLDLFEEMAEELYD
jgi:hypothetical protein